MCYRGNSGSSVDWKGKVVPTVKDVARKAVKMEKRDIQEWFCQKYNGLKR